MKDDKRAWRAMIGDDCHMVVQAPTRAVARMKLLEFFNEAETDEDILELPIMRAMRWDGEEGVDLSSPRYEGSVEKEATKRLKAKLKDAVARPPWVDTTERLEAKWKRR